jgi:hypothetical protein
MISWNKVELAICDEIEFLKNHIQPAPYSQNEPINCLDCIFREIAILIVSGRVKLCKISTTKNLWSGAIPDSAIKAHGSTWHDQTIKTIAEYLEQNSILPEYEPSMLFGRADLGATSISTYFEVGTINLYKLYVNLLKQQNIKIIIVPTDTYILEFTI